MYLWPQEETTSDSTPENSYGRVLTTNQFISFHVIPLEQWRWVRSLENSAHPGLVVLPASFWKHERMDG